METFTDLKDFVDNPYSHDQRKKCVSNLDIESIDTPIVELISGLAKLDYCFTLQSCYGHFLYNSQKNPYNICNGQKQTSDREKMQEEKKTNEARHIDDKTGGTGDMCVFDIVVHRM